MAECCCAYHQGRKHVCPACPLCGTGNPRQNHTCTVAEANFVEGPDGPVVAWIRERGDHGER